MTELNAANEAATTTERLQDPSPHRSLDVLVVEDNPVNQKLMVALLVKWGHRTVIAGDGACGLKSLEGQDFDLVLMDIQMPVMDGITAICSIRAAERARGGHIPIIAITAHAAAEDRARCLDAGADRYLTKPMNPKFLRNAIAELLPAASRAPSLTWAQNTGGQIDFERLKEFVGDDPELLAEVVQIFLDDAPMALDSAASAISRADSSALEASAHRLKGSLSTLGATGASETANRLETMGRNGVLAGAAELFERLRREVGHTRESLRLWKGARTA